jgi:hypothetical protein
MTMNKTAADFDGLSDALTYAAPVAKNAGVSIEQPPQWSARFMMPKSPAQWLGRAAVLSKSPTGSNRQSIRGHQRARR